MNALLCARCVAAHAGNSMNAIADAAAKAHHELTSEAIPDSMGNRGEDAPAQMVNAFQDGSVVQAFGNMNITAQGGGGAGAGSEPLKRKSVIPTKAK